VLEIASLFHYKSRCSAPSGVGLPTLFFDRFRHVSTSRCTGFAPKNGIDPKAEIRRMARSGLA
jgi:hypothetical protein